jgi:hypothetical protein
MKSPIDIDVIFEDINFKKPEIDGFRDWVSIVRFPF